MDDLTRMAMELDLFLSQFGSDPNEPPDDRKTFGDFERCSRPRPVNVGLDVGVVIGRYTLSYGSGKAEFSYEHVSR